EPRLDRLLHVRLAAAGDRCVELEIVQAHRGGLELAACAVARPAHLPPRAVAAPVGAEEVDLGVTLAGALPQERARIARRQPGVHVVLAANPHPARRVEARRGVEE